MVGIHLILLDNSVLCSIVNNLVISDIKLNKVIYLKKIVNKSNN